MKIIKCTLCAANSEFLTSTKSKLQQADYYQCQNCAFIFQERSSHISPEAEAKFYTTHENSLDDPGYLNFLKPAMETARRYIQDKNTSALDYGCGPAPALAQMLNDNNIANTNFYDPIYFNEKELLRKQYNLITCTEVVEHFRNPGNDWLQLTNLLQQDAVLVVMTEAPPADLDNFNKWYYQQDPTHIAFYSADCMQNLASNFGLDLLEQTNRITVFKKKD